MNLLDYSIIFAYLLMLLLLGFVFRQQRQKQDYFLGGRALGWQPLSLSIMATQLSAISFISAPAFVGLREGGGMIWLSYELALPIAMLLLLWKLLPTLHRSGVISVYDFLERRFDASSRLLISLVFQISRSFATAIMIYAVSIILQGAIGLAFWQSILFIGVITLIYSLQGGMRAVVYGDAIQMILIVFAAALCLYFGLTMIGGWEQFWQQVEPARLQAINTDSNGFDGSSFGLLPMLFGGLVLYASYYGCDQSEAQRALSAKNPLALKKMIMAATILRFPISLLYCTAGLVIGTFALQTPAFLAQIPADKPDWMMPVFIINYMPNGIIGILLVAILAAAMSSLSSAINSLSAVTVEDFCRLIRVKPNDQQYLTYARYAGVFWGLVTLLLSSFAGSIAPTVIEAINKIGSVFYGPVLATFLLAIGSTRVQAKEVNLGLACGLLCNLVLWLSDNPIFWFWWNLAGFLTTVAVATVASYLTAAAPSKSGTKLSVANSLNLDNVLLMLGWFVFIFVLCLLMNHLSDSLTLGYNSPL